VYKRQVYTGIKQREEQKEYSEKQASLQAQKKKKQLSKRKKKIDLMRRETLAPSFFGGKRSLQSGSERGLMSMAQTREVLG